MSDDNAVVTFSNHFGHLGVYFCLVKVCPPFSVELSAFVFSAVQDIYTVISLSVTTVPLLGGSSSYFPCDVPC